jgi:DNA-binding LacI/PurR family transcriptional regulator
MGFGALRALRSHGLTPGKDISVVGVDGHDMSEYLELSSVVQPVADLGRIAAESLLTQLKSSTQNVPLEPVMLPTQLIVRSSTAPIR